MNKLNKVLALIDQANSADPNVETDKGQPCPKELLYSQRMSSTLEVFSPGASDHLKIAARGQHIERWSSLRSAYPEGRSGYKKWRAELGLFHAKRVGELMAEAGYDIEDIERTQYIVQKRGLKRDAETQCFEDVICLVFLQYYLDDFAQKHEEPKLVDIIQKTWGKMSDAGHTAVLKLPFSEQGGALVKKALAS